MVPALPLEVSPFVAVVRYISASVMSSIIQPWMVALASN